MKRNARRAVLFVCLVAGAGFVQAKPAGAGLVCVTVRVSNSGSTIPVRHCVATPPPLGYHCISYDQTVVVGLGVEVCGPV